MASTPDNKPDPASQTDGGKATMVAEPTGQSAERKITMYGDHGKRGPATRVEDILFNLFAERDGMVNVAKFWRAINATGIRTSDLRMRETLENFTQVQIEAGINPDMFTSHRVDQKTFNECTADNFVIITKALKGLVIPEFTCFTEEIGHIFAKCKANTKGKIATYIPQLARVSPDKFGVAICTIDGQRESYGDHSVPFCLQSCGKPLSYALAISDLGSDKVHQYVGQEPSGRSFNGLMLNQNNRPHNPMINAGAIVITSLLHPKLSPADRFDHVFNQHKRMAGGEYVGFSNATGADVKSQFEAAQATAARYLSEREHTDRNFALGYYMRENKCFPEDTHLMQTMEFYFQLCSVEVTAESASVIAATLANGGICPTTGERVLAGDAVRNTLSLMHSCGMYDYSGQFAFNVGLPAKSGAAGGILLVVPNVMGICIWSPALDDLGNSSRGIQFCEELVSRFNFHNYDDLNHTERKRDPRKRKIDIQANAVRNILFGATNGDVTAIRRFAMMGMNMGVADCDGRTALHLACAEGHLHLVRVLLEQCEVPYDPKDRWGVSPLDDARRAGQEDVLCYLLGYESDLKAGNPPRISRRQSDFFSL